MGAVPDLERHGLVVTSQTLWDLANVLARRLACVDAALQAHVLAQPVIGLEQTASEPRATRPRRGIA